MVKPSIFVTRRLPRHVEHQLGALFDPQFNEDDNLPSAEALLRGAQNADGLLVTITDRLDANLISALPERTRIIATFSVGYDHIDIAAADARGIAVTNTPGVLTDATAEIAMLLLLGAARKATDGARLIRENRWGAWAPTGMLGTQLTGKKLGIYGMGEIGRAVAARARPFGMEIHYHNRNQLPAALEAGAHYHAELESLLRHCDMLSVNCASTPQTRGSLDADRLALMKPGAILINTARGDILDEAAVLDALSNGRLGAIGLDVYANEPDIDPRFRTLPNSFLLPHLGSATYETRDAMGFCAIANLQAFFSGKTPPNRVR
ncbi:MAG TPA: D-glycerate dehydrogenase [Alphaproteobacteria bacterium]|nr:D-glycerate dehydrogenase [Alphaproteobacteria bacterium]